MTDLLLQIGLSKLVLSVLVAGVALVVQRATPRPELGHNLWLLAIVTLLLPSLVAVPIIDVLGVTSALSLNAGQGGGDARNGVVPMLAFGGLTGTDLVFLAWLLGSISVLVCSIARTVHFHRAMGRAIRPAPEGWQRFVAEAAMPLGLRRVPRMFTTAARVSPMVWTGCRGARLVVPEFLLTSMDAEHTRWIVAHELAHLRRGDHLIRWLEWLACVVFWWNPVVWLARRELRAAEERCCDAMVVRSFGADARSYAGSLVSVLEYLSVPGALGTPAHVSPAIRGKQGTALERRLTSLIANSQGALAPNRLRALLFASAVMITPLGLVNYAGTAAAGAPAFQLDEAALSGSPKQRLAQVGKELKQAVGTGQISEVRGRQLFQDMERRLGIGSVTPATGNATTQPTYDAVAIRIRGAVEGGKLTPEEGRARLLTYQKRLLEPTPGNDP